MGRKCRRRESLRNKMLLINCCITLAALVLGGIVLVVSIHLIVGKYINNDMDFFLTETCNNVANRMDYLEEIIYSVRESDEIMDYLGREDHEPGGLLALQADFEKRVDINDAKNSGRPSQPLIDKVCLFDRSGDSIQASYYAMIYSEAEKSSKDFQDIFSRFKTEGSGNELYARCYTGEEKRGYIAYGIFDSNMRETGTLIFEIHLDAIEGMMENMENYEDYMWLLYEGRGEPVCGTRMLFEDQGWQEVRTVYEERPYTASLYGKSYRLCLQELCLGMSVMAAVPSGQTAALLNNSIKLYVMLIVLIMIAAAVLFIMVIYYLTRPLKEVTGRLMEVKEGNFETKLPEYSSQEFHEISHTFNEMTAYISHLINQVYEKQLSIKELEVKFLQMQMNPHFMFNVLNTIALEAKMNGDEEVYKMISSFAQLIQAKIYRKNTEKVKIRQELEYVEYYLYLQSYRFGERLSYSVTADEKLKELYIPKLCIQLIVENAVIHGIEPMMENGVVSVRIYEEGGKLYIETKDNGVGFGEDGPLIFPMETQEEDRQHNHVGLNNVHNIIRLMYGEEYGLSGYSRRNGGTSIYICVPLDEGGAQLGDMDHV